MKQRHFGRLRTDGLVSRKVKRKVYGIVAELATKTGKPQAYFLNQLSAEDWKSMTEIERANARAR